MKRIGYIILLIAFASCSDFQKITNSQDLDEKYEAAVNYYNGKDFYRAGLLFEELIPLYVGRKEAEMSQYYYCYCHYNQDQLFLASHYFDIFTKNFPRSERVEECAFMNCKSLYYLTPASNLEQNSTKDALVAIQSFVDEYPTSTYLPECNKMVDELNGKLELKAYNNAKQYHQLRYFKSAVISLENFIKEYPGSSHVEEMMYLKLDSQCELAKISVKTKQEERYLTAVDFYRDYIDKFTEGKYNKDAGSVYDEILSGLDKIKKEKS